MCKETEEIYNEGYAEGYAEGFAEGFAKGYAEGIELTRRKIVSNLAARGIKEADIADILTLDVELAKEWLSGCETFSSAPQ